MIFFALKTSGCESLLFYFYDAPVRQTEERTESTRRGSVEWMGYREECISQVIETE